MISFGDEISLEVTYTNIRVMSGLMMRGVVGVNKFKGALVGALLGDCLGAPFEGENEPSTDTVQEYFDAMENSASSG